jgi:hypothetical protein
LARELASLRTAIGDVATRDYLRTEIGDAMEDLLMKLKESKKESK